MDIVSLTMYVIISFIGGILMIGTALGLFYINFGIPLLDKYFSYEMIAGDIAIRLTLFLIGTLVILCVMRQVQNLLTRSKRHQYVTFNAPHGPIRITLFAIEDMIKKLLDSKNELSNIRPRVTVKNDELGIEIRANIAADVNIIAATKDMQQRIHEKLNQILGDQHSARINVEISKMFLGPKKNNSSEDDPEVPFRNYVE